MAQLLRLPPGTPVAVYSHDVVPQFPAVSALSLAWASRYSGLWPLRALLGALHHPTGPRNERLLDTYWDAFTGSLAEDLERHRPARVLLDLDDWTPLLPPGVDVLDLLGRDARFAAAWSRYRPVYEGHGLRACDRRPDAAPAT